MPEEKKVTLMGRRAGELLAGLSGIVDDLWGETPSPQARQPQQPAAAQQPEFPPFTQLWKVADETIDWTDALAHEKPTDSLTDPAQWALYHQYAAQVLAGDTDAYLAVVEALQPLGDLTAYADSFSVAAPSSGTLAASFQVLPRYMDKPDDEPRRYMAGMAVRVARDLFALLPVNQVQVAVLQGEKTLLSVNFEKSEMMKVRFAFIDPIAFTLQCGGEFIT